MAGVKEAEAGLLGFNPVALAAGLALGGLVMAGRAAIEISKEHFKAQANLNNAIANSARVITPSLAAQQEITKAIAAHKKALQELAAAQQGRYIPAIKLTDRELMNLHFAEERVARSTGKTRADALLRLNVLQEEYAAKTHGATTKVGNLAAAEQRAADTAAKLAELQRSVGATIHQTGVNAKDVQDVLEKFIATNRDFISSNNEVTNAFASLIREGVKTKDLSRLMSLALNIQAVEGGTLTDAVGKLQQAEVGRNKGLSTAVGLVLNAVPAHATYAQKLKIIEANLKAVERAYGTQKPKVDQLTISTNHLKTDWEDLAQRGGPQLTGALSAVLGAVDQLYQNTDKMGKDNAMWASISQRWTDLAGQIRGVALQIGVAKLTPKEQTQSDAQAKVQFGRVIGPDGALTPAQLDAYFKKNLSPQEYKDYHAKALAKQDQALAFWKDYGAKQLAALQLVQGSIDGISYAIVNSQNNALNSKDQNAQNAADKATLERLRRLNRTFR